MTDDLVCARLAALQTMGRHKGGGIALDMHSADAQYWPHCIGGAIGCGIADKDSGQRFQRGPGSRHAQCDRVRYALGWIQKHCYMALFADERG
ncbi:MAG: hypothetical protein NVSMB6_14090 [Burkholderiaceae bacterium]